MSTGRVLPFRRCDMCDDAAGAGSGAGRGPARFRGAPWGVTGVICLRCREMLRGRKRRAEDRRRREEGPG